MYKYFNISQFISSKMCTLNKSYLKLEKLNNEIFKNLRNKTLLMKKENVYVYPPEKYLSITDIEKSCPLIFGTLKHKYKIDTTLLETKVILKKYLESCKNDCSDNLQTNSSRINFKELDVNDNINLVDNNNNKINNEKIEKNNFDAISSFEGNNSVDFLDSFVQLKIPILSEYEQNHLFKHIIEIIDSLAADVVYRHSMGSYKKNNKFNFVTVLFNNLKVYQKNKIHHEFCFSLDQQKPLTINCYIVHSGNTSYILKVDFFQENQLIFDIYSTFVNINNLTFKPQLVAGVSNHTKNKEYEEVKEFASHLKDIQNLFNHKDVKNKYLDKKDINFILNYFKNVRVEKKPYIKNIYENTNIFEQNEKKDEEYEKENILSVIDDILDKDDLSFYIGKSNFYCKDSYVESNYFISSEFKNIHNFTFGGYLAYLSFCHAMVIIKNFVAYPVLIEINEIQYILPVPYNSVVSFKGKVVYCDKEKIQIKISSYCFDFKRSTYFLTTIFDLSFENNCEISFIPQSDEEIKFYLFSYIRSQLLQ
ncbi:conserved Plasmodium protein, unknown function [Plasmodium gallinaceum]|uniref:HotDog ACOT-type domain-containing protein n=1 Tax=Plasmodium gallinaceum TaxID=5849 RepID=A0A1J1GQ15_PLAGA|nr:conserved Plasmodium protein, unknown function [Plasmodium gallinaceum]CRG94382.1 conserved Plasmodium protein, unknown function [Plasmodium gallinaceum]